MFQRECNPLKSNSFFLFGARGTGKTTLLSELAKKNRVLRFDFLAPETEEEFALNPVAFKEQILAQASKIDWVILDEIQRVPKLLNYVHMLIESHKIKFAMTGSSARKLKRGQANMLAGRAFLNHLFPLTHTELGTDFDLDKVLNWGSLPKTVGLKENSEKRAYLKSYVSTFIQEEIKGEQLIRKLDPFRKFLPVAAQGHAKVINFTNIQKDIGVDVKTIQNYYSILEETYIGFFLEPYHRSIRKAQSQRPKFYFFDIGVQRSISHNLDVTPKPGTSYFGEVFESFVILEAYRKNTYSGKDYELSFLRTKEGNEVDLIVRRPGKKTLFVEIKSSADVRLEKLNFLNSIAADDKNAEAVCFYNGKTTLLIGKTKVFPWREGLQYIFD